MKNIVIFLFLLLVVLFSCKKDKTKMGLPGESLEEKLTNNLNYLHGAAEVFSRVFKQSGDTLAAFDSMRAMIGIQEGVKDGWFHNEEFLEIEFKNGLISPITIIPVGNKGEHLQRGGGKGAGANQLKSFGMKALDTKKIKNKKALVLMPYPSEFIYTDTKIDQIRAAFKEDAEMELDLKIGSEVKLETLNSLGDYGLIILDVHGVKNGFFLSYLQKDFSPKDVWFPEDLIKNIFDIKSIPADKIANNQIQIGLEIRTHSDGNTTFAFNVLITESYIKQLNVDLTDAVVFGNHCYSGHTADGKNQYNLPEAWKAKGIATYYGYAFNNQVSHIVDNVFCQTMELLLIKGLVGDGDSTGNAHLLADGSQPFYDHSKGYKETRGTLFTPVKPKPPGRSMFFSQFFAKDYAYERCGDDVVDPRDSQVYKTVCIGDQVWMAQNMNYDIGTNWCYDNDPKNCESNGRLYDWSSAMKACPKGWHLASEAEWLILTNELGGTEAAGGKLKSISGWDSPNVGATNSSGFSAMGGGYGYPSLTPPKMDFSNYGKMEKYFTSTVTSVEEVVGLLIWGSSEVVSFSQYYDKVGGYSCRCIKDK